MIYGLIFWILTNLLRGPKRLGLNDKKQRINKNIDKKW